MLKPLESDQETTRKIYPNLPNHASSEAEFIAFVNEGLVSLEISPTHDLETVLADIRKIISAHE